MPPGKMYFDSTSFVKKDAAASFFFFLLQKYAIIHPLGVLGMSIIMANHLKKSFGVDVVLEDVVCSFADVIWYDVRLSL